MEPVSVSQLLAALFEAHGVEFVVHEGWVAPGGRLVVVGHDVENLERGTGGPQMAEVLTTVPGVLAALEPVGLTIDRAEVAERPVIAADGSAAIALDTVVVGRRA